MIEFILSIVLVIGISEISHTSQSFITSPYLSILVVLFFALLKVTLEKYIVAPKMEYWGWELYKKAILNYKEKLLLIISISFLLRQSIHEENSIDKIHNIFRVGIREYID